MSIRAERLLSAMSLLRALGRVTAADLAQHLGVSERTVNRDMDALSAAGVPVFPVRGPQASWQLDDEWRRQSSEPAESELRAIFTTEASLSGDGALAAAATEIAFDRLAEALPESARQHASSLREKLYVDTTGWRGGNQNLEALPAVQEAVSRDRKLVIGYTRAGRERVERTLDPLGLVVKGTNWYLVARTADGFRTYRVSRIDEARVLEQPSERPPNFCLAEYWKTSMAQFEEELSRAEEAQRRASAERLEAERRAAQEIEIAKQVQARLFPQTRPALETLDYAGACIQARQVGGDYYDFLDLGRRRLGIVVSDIAGKGIAAALLMANLQANLRSQCAVASDRPDRFLKSVNQIFYDNTDDSAYATMFFAEYDDRTRRLQYANCGHLAALLLRRDQKLERLSSTCTVLGLFREWTCGMEDRTLFPGDTVVFYTDGVTEALNAAEEEFGEARLIDSLRRGRDLSSEALMRAIVDDVLQFSQNQEQHDDITVLVARCRGD